MDIIVLNPESVTATWTGGTLTVVAAGHDDGVRDVEVAQLDATTFQVQALPSAAIGWFPYEATGEFGAPADPGEIVLHTRAGDRGVPVRVSTDA
jgi:hypothetical protein